MKTSTKKYSENTCQFFFKMFSQKLNYDFEFSCLNPMDVKINDSHAQDVLHQHQANSSFIHQLTWMLNIQVSFPSFVIFTSIIFHVPPSISSNLPPLSKNLQKVKIVECLLLVLASS
jgi:hypothetical protein